MEDAGISKQLWDIIDHDELIQNIGNLRLFDIPVSTKDIRPGSDAQQLMIVFLDHSEGNKAARIQQIGDRIYGLYSLREIDELKVVSKRIDHLIDFHDLFSWAGLFATVGDRVWDYLM